MINDIDAKLLERQTQIGLEKGGIAALGDDKVALPHPDLREDAHAVLDTMLAPEVKLPVEARDMGIVAEDDRD